VCIRCRGNVFTETLPSNDKWDTERQASDLVSLLLFFQSKENRQKWILNLTGFSGTFMNAVMNQGIFWPAEWLSSRWLCAMQLIDWSERICRSKYMKLSRFFLQVVAKICSFNGPACPCCTERNSNLSVLYAMLSTIKWTILRDFTVPARYLVLSSLPSSSQSYAIVCDVNFEILCKKDVALYCKAVNSCSPEQHMPGLIGFERFT
jgi:hypothetical protein